MSERLSAWKEAGRVFLWSRLLLLAVTCVCVFLVPLWMPGYTSILSQQIYHIFPSEAANQFFFSWLRWDVKAFLNISWYGYAHVPDTAFFPLWPLLAHLGGLALGGQFPASFYLSGLLLSNLFFYLALVMLYQLVVKGYGQSVAKRTLYYFTFSPFAIFFFAGYSESLFILLCLGMFLALQRGRPGDWWLAGLCGLLATLSRSLGLLLAVPFLVVYVRCFWWNGRALESTWRARLNALAPLVLLPLGLAIYMFYLYLTKGNALIFQAQEAAIWSRQTTFPLWTLVISVQAFFQPHPFIWYVGNLIDILPELIFFIALGKGWKSLPLHYSLFALVMALVTLSQPIVDPMQQAMASQPRYIMILFPVAIVFALWGKDRRIDGWLRVSMTITFALAAAVCISNIWVA